MSNQSFLPQILRSVGWRHQFSLALAGFLVPALATGAIANELPTVVADPESSVVNVSPDRLDTEMSVSELTEYLDELNAGGQVAIDPLGDGLTPAPMGQVTSVSQLSDVQPTDWAFQALQSLVERYGCIAGYPDGTFRGNRALTRYEFAAGLNACLDRILEITGGDADSGDLATIQQLQEEFAAELATLRGRVDSLEARVSELEANQFSTTTKLSGLTFFHVAGASADGPVLAETGTRGLLGRPNTRSIETDPQISMSHLVWLSLNTSFTGQDNLGLQLAMGDAGSPANQFVSAGLFNTYGTPFTLQSPSAGGQVVVRELFYSFPVTDGIRLTVGPQVNWYRYFDGNRFTFFLNGANSFNSSGGTQTNTLDRGAGAVAEIDLGPNFDLRLAYLAENTEFLPGPPFRTAGDPSEGLFSGTYSMTAELGFTTGDINLRGLYTRSRLNRSPGGTVGGALGEPIYGIADDGFGGAVHDAYADTFSASFDWLVTDGIGVFGRYSYGDLSINPVNGALDDGSIQSQALQLGLAFPDLGKEGALLTFSYLKPFAILDGRSFLVSGGGDGGVQYEFEMSYTYPLTSNIWLVPSVYVIGNPNNFADNPTIVVGNLQTQFRF